MEVSKSEFVLKRWALSRKERKKEKQTAIVKEPAVDARPLREGMGSDSEENKYVDSKEMFPLP